MFEEKIMIVIVTDQNLQKTILVLAALKMSKAVALLRGPV